MKQLLILCLLSLPAQAHGQETSPIQLPPATTDPTQPLPRSKDDQKKSGGAKKPSFNPIDKIEKSLEARRKQIAEARKKARDRARAQREAQQPEEPALILPSNSSPKKDLSGNWISQDESLKETLVRQFQKTVGKDASFKLRKITGKYTVSVSPDLT